MLLVGCCWSCLPFDYDSTLSTSLARSAPKDDYTNLGVTGAVQVRPASSGVDFGAEGGVATTLDQTVTQWRALASLGYGIMPRPFEGHWGFVIEGLAGVGSMAVMNSPRFGVLTGPSEAVYYRLTASNEVWDEDASPTKELFLFLGGRLLGTIPTAGADHEFRIEYAGALGLMLSCYSLGAP